MARKSSAAKVMMPRTVAAATEGLPLKTDLEDLVAIEVVVVALDDSVLSFDSSSLALWSSRPSWYLEPEDSSDSVLCCGWMLFGTSVPRE